MASVRDRSRVIDWPSILPKNALVLALTEFFDTLSDPALEDVRERGLGMTQSEPLGLVGSLPDLADDLHGAGVMDSFGGGGQPDPAAPDVDDLGRVLPRSVLEAAGEARAWPLPLLVVGSGGGDGSVGRFSFWLWTSLAGTTVPRSFALRARVARSGLLEVPGDR